MFDAKRNNWSIYDWYQSPSYWLFELFEWQAFIGDDGTLWQLEEITNV